MKLLEENIGGMLLDIGLADDFFGSLIKAKEIEAKKNKGTTSN